MLYVYFPYKHGTELDEVNLYDAINKALFYKIRNLVHLPNIPETIRYLYQSI
jgi:hypothetical protein